MHQCLLQTYSFTYSYLLYSSSHPSHHHKSRTPYLFHSFSDFVVYVVTTLIFPKNQRQCDSFSINVVILSLSFKRATTVPNKLIDSQHYKRLRRTTPSDRIPFTLTFHPHNHTVKSIILKNFIQKLALSFRNPTYFIQT